MPKSSATICIQEGCTLAARYNYRGGQHKWCSMHRTADMINTHSRICIYGTCTVSASFALAGDPTAKLIPQWCAKHKPAQAVHAYRKGCQYPECSKWAKFGEPGKPVWCREHATEDAMPSWRKYCQQPDCNMIALYSLAGDRPRWCRMHSPLGAKISRIRKCEYSKCGAVACYGDDEYSEVSWCARHKPAISVLRRNVRLPRVYDRGSIDRIRLCTIQDCANEVNTGVSLSFCSEHIDSDHRIDQEEPLLVRFNCMNRRAIENDKRVYVRRKR